MRNMYTYTIALATFFSLSFNTLQAQSIELGVFLGSSFYSGDLQPQRYTSKESHVAVGGVLKYRLTEYLTLRAAVKKGKISGHDFNSSKGSGRYGRNLSFVSKILEYNVQGEFHPFPFIFEDQKRISPYVMAGVGVLSFNPQAYHENQWYDLQPLGTEGQYLTESDAKPYNLTQFVIPAGMGVSFRVSDYNTIDLEVGLRKTFTDYLDDVSTVYPDIDRLRVQNPVAAELSYRTNELLEEPNGIDPSGMKRGSEYKDWYTFFGINFNFNISRMANISDVGNYEVF